jgi:hypothetical protein
MGLVACVHAESKACSLSHVEQGVHGVRRVELCRGWRTSLVLCLSPARRSVCVAVTGDGARACVRVRREGPGEGAARTSVRPRSVASLLQSGVGQVFGVGQRRHEAIRAARGAVKWTTDSCGELRLMARRPGTPGTSRSSVRSSVRGLRGRCVAMAIKPGCNHHGDVP